jgi:thioredoxin 1
MKTTIEVNAANFTKEVLNSTQPVIVDFWAERCGPCHVMEPILEEIAGEYGSRVKIARVNVDANPGLAERHYIQSLPTLIYFAQGLVQDQIVGEASKRMIVSKLENCWRLRSRKAAAAGKFSGN